MKNLEKFKENAVYFDAVNGKLAHSLLLISTDEYALENFTQNLVKTLMCVGENKPCGECSECRKIEHKNHVDVLYYPKSAKTLNSNEIAELIDSAFQAPYTADKKIFVIQNANNIDISMQNKLLKTLEEPPHNTYFLLQATDDNNILQTIKSRCRIVQVPSVDDDEILAELSKFNLDREQQKNILLYCENNCSLALKFASSSDFMEFVKLSHNILQNYRKSSQMLDFASVLYKLDDSFEEFLNIFLKDCSFVISYLCTNESVNEIALTVLKDFSVDALVNIVKNCNDLIEKRARNCNFNTIVDSFLLMILEVRHKWPV